MAFQFWTSTGTLESSTGILESSTLARQARDLALGRAIRLGFWLVAATLAVLQAWSARYQINSDGVSYLDIADLLWGGDWNHAFNSIWSPGYPFLLGLALHAARPPMAWESTVVHLTNTSIFLGTMGCFP